MTIISLPDYFSPLKIGELRAIKQATGVDRLYVSIITGRCGSTYLSEICSRSGFGIGEEPFNEQPLSDLEELFPERSFVDFLTRVFTYGAMNGTLYFQITPPRLALLRKLIPEPDFAQQTDAVSFITRRNILSQAISFHNAKRTGLWHTSHELQAGSGSGFDPQEVLAWMRYISVMEEGLLNFVLDTKPLHLFYEDLIASPYETISLFLKFHRHPVRPVLLNNALIENGISKKIPTVDFNLQFTYMVNTFPWIVEIITNRMDNSISPQYTIDEITKYCPSIENVPL
jgi:hypothetical protein